MDGIFDEMSGGETWHDCLGHWLWGGVCALKLRFAEGFRGDRDGHLTGGEVRFAGDFDHDRDGHATIR